MNPPKCDDLDYIHPAHDAFTRLLFRHGGAGAVRYLCLVGGTGDLSQAAQGGVGNRPDELAPHPRAGSPPLQLPGVRQAHKNRHFREMSQKADCCAELALSPKGGTPKGLVFQTVSRDGDLCCGVEQAQASAPGFAGLLAITGGGELV